MFWTALNLNSVYYLQNINIRQLKYYKDRVAKDAARAGSVSSKKQTPATLSSIRILEELLEPFGGGSPFSYFLPVATPSKNVATTNNDVATPVCNCIVHQTDVDWIV